MAWKYDPEETTICRKILKAHLKALIIIKSKVKTLQKEISSTEFVILKFGLKM